MFEESLPIRPGRRLVGSFSQLINLVDKRAWTSERQRRTESGDNHMTLCEAMTSDPETQPLPGALVKLGVAINLRPRQRLAVGHDSSYIYLVRSGVLMLEGLPQTSSRQILDLYYRGDIVRPAIVPALPGINLLSATQAEVLRIANARLDSLTDTDADARRWCDCAMARQYPRRLLQLATIGTLTGEERVASMLVEFALRMCEGAHQESRTFELPLTRTDMADYLSLNADTLSRVMSRLRQSGVLGTAGRARAFVPNFSALCALTPLADTIKSVHEAKAMA